MIIVVIKVSIWYLTRPKQKKNSISCSCVNNFRTLSMKCMNKSIRYQKAEIHCSYLVKSINITFVVQRFLRHQQVNGKCFVNVWDYCPHIKNKINYFITSSPKKRCIDCSSRINSFNIPVFINIFHRDKPLYLNYHVLKEYVLLKGFNKWHLQSIFFLNNIVKFLFTNFSISTHASFFNLKLK